MVKSMTGYGRAEDIIDGRSISVEVKSVNHRYFDFTAKVPRSYAYLEEKLKTFFQKNVSRGKIEVYVNIGMPEDADIKVEINDPLAKGYVSALNELSQIYGLSGEISASMISKFPDVLSVSKAEEDEEKVTSDVLSVAQKALDIFVSMRTAEGERLRQDVDSRLSYILELVAFVEEQSPKTVEAYRTRLESKIRELLEDRTADESRILTEVAIFSDKVAVNEETVRLRSHIAAIRELFDSRDAIGKKMDFLVQEMNREANTTGSKCQDVEVTRRVVAIKAEIEKVREQIQNIE